MQSITVSNLSLAAPDGRVLLENLNLTFGRERIGLVGRNGVGKTTLLNIITGDVPPPTGTVVAPGRAMMLRQTVRQTPGITLADLFEARAMLAKIACAEAGLAAIDEIATIDWTVETRIQDALAKLKLHLPLQTPVETLSGGQRTRAELAVLLFHEPAHLILDEPTNNLDRDGRRAVIDLVASWKGGAIVVSHDRELLETMDAIVELTALGATRYGGNWSHYRLLKQTELEAAGRHMAEANRQVTEAARKTQAAADRQARRNSAGRRKEGKGDMPRIVLGGRKQQAENTGAANERLAERLRNEASAAQAAARAQIEVLQPFTVALPPSGLAAGKAVLKVDRLTAGYDQDRPILRDLSMSITGPERVAVTGPNGSGKSTLLKAIAGDIAPFSGVVATPAGSVLFDQQLSLLDRSASIRDNFKRLNPAATENACRVALARFKFRANAALQLAGTLSGGEMLRAGLACVLGGETLPQLIILDEPTNHLDIDSIETVEAGLRAFDGALLIVSHDEAFLDNVGVSRRIDIAPA